MTKNNKKSEVNHWLKTINPETFEKMLEGPEILPSFKPYKNTVYNIKVLSEPREIEAKGSKFFVMDIERDGMKFSLNLNNSFLYQLALILKRNGLKSDDIIGKTLLISKDDLGFYSVQLA